MFCGFSGLTRTGVLASGIARLPATPEMNPVGAAGPTRADINCMNMKLECRCQAAIGRFDQRITELGRKKNAADHCQHRDSLSSGSGGSVRAVAPTRAQRQSSCCWMCSPTASGDEELDRQLSSPLPNPSSGLRAANPATEISFCGEFVYLLAVMVLGVHQQGDGMND